MRRSQTSVGITLGLSFFLGMNIVFSPTLHAQVAFYQGKTVRVIRGGLAGELYDLWARLIASHLGKHVPGNPNVIVQNMPGAGSVIAANYLYNVAKPDGLTIGALNPGIYMDQLLGRKEVQFDWAKFNWIGTPEQTEFLFIIRADSPYKSIENLRAATEPPKCGSTGTASILFQLAKLMEETLGTKFTLITGYQGAPDVDVAIERGEVQCRTITTAAFFGREPYITWGKKGFVRPLMQTGRGRNPSLADVSTIYELMDRYKTTEAGRRLATLILAQNLIGRPMVAPPGIPAERLKTLRDAWNNALKDPELLAESKKRGWPVEPVGGEELATLAKEVIGQPPDAVQRLKKLLGE